MGNSSFTRDEVILALDVLYKREKDTFSAKAEDVIELSNLLKRLPIHSLEDKKRSTFRSPSGITQQVNLFVRSCRHGEKHQDVGNIFFDVAFDFEDNRQALHNIAAAIRRNEQMYSIPFGHKIENLGFPEGVLLGHLHHVIENKAKVLYGKDDKCCVCGLQPANYYSGEFDLLELHLTVSPEHLDGSIKYSLSQFITVCPTCHSALHHYRPWRSEINCEDILR